MNSRRVIQTGLALIIVAAISFGSWALFYDRAFTDPEFVKGPNVATTCSRLINLVTREQNHDIDGTYFASYCHGQLVQGIWEISVAGFAVLAGVAGFVIVSTRRRRNASFSP